MSGLAITTLTLSHFRSHRAARLQFDGRPVAIVGANGAGKTNILEAVSLLSPGRGMPMPSVGFIRGGAATFAAGAGAVAVAFAAAESAGAASAAAVAALSCASA